jgi:hypothetical protein
MTYGIIAMLILVTAISIVINLYIIKIYTKQISGLCDRIMARNFDEFRAKTVDDYNMSLPPVKQKKLTTEERLQAELNAKIDEAQADSMVGGDSIL